MGGSWVWVYEGGRVGVCVSGGVGVGVRVCVWVGKRVFSAVGAADWMFLFWKGGCGWVGG